MQRYFSHICDGTDVQAEWRRNCTYGRATNAIDILQGSLELVTIELELSASEVNVSIQWSDNRQPIIAKPRAVGGVF